MRATDPAISTSVVTDPDRDFIPAEQDFVRSDTGELLRNWNYGIHVIDIPKTQAVSGWIEGKALKTKDALFLFDNKKATVALSSLDGQPLVSSRFIMITAMARAVPSPGNRMPMLSEPVVGSISLKTSITGLELVALGPGAKANDRSEPAIDQGTLTLRVPTRHGTHWYVLKAGK